jgi:hypothetical protein
VIANSDTIYGRNILMAYAQRRLQESVLKPLRVDGTDVGALDKYEKVLSCLRDHFRGLGFEIGQLYVDDGEFAVDLVQVPR